MTASVTALYAAVAALLTLALGFNVSLQRRAHGIGLGAGERGQIATAIRAHSNAVEYVPAALILLLLLELNGARAWVLHALGASLIVARLAHAQGMLMHGGSPSPGRFVGALGTWAVIAIAALVLLWQAAISA